MTALILKPCWSGPIQLFRHTWEEVINVDQYRWLVRHDLLEHLALVQRELGARHVRAVGMFDDEMRVLRPSPDTFGAAEPRPVRTNWQLTDYIWDELLDRGLSPMFTTSFIPSHLAGGPTTVFTTQGRTSPPRDYREWGELVTESVYHAVDRYGIELVRGWYFEVWNEPNLQGWFWGADQAEFFKLWASTYHAIKSVDAGFRIGGPSTARAEWLADFVEFGRRHDCPADYLALHIYNNDGEAVALAPFAGPQEDKAGTSPNLAAGVIRGARALADQLEFKGEIHFNEWGRSWRPVEPDRESANEAAFIVRTMAEVSQEADQFAYWCVSDIYDQVGYGRETFHGNYGLLNLHGLRKPSYHAFSLLHRMGTQRVAVDHSGPELFSGAIATLEPGRACVLVYVYRHGIVAAPEGLKVEVELPADAGDSLQLHRIDSLENNSLARWRDLGAPVYLHPRDRAALAAVDALQASDSPVTVTRRNDRVFATFFMEAPGVALLTIPRGVANPRQ
jgi:xylan 1,4-beta-xylosidase